MFDKIIGKQTDKASREAEDKIKLIQSISTDVLDVLKNKHLSTSEVTMCLQHCISLVQKRGHKLIRPHLDEINEMNFEDLMNQSNDPYDR